MTTIGEYVRLMNPTDGINPMMKVWGRGFRTVCGSAKPGALTQAQLVEFTACYELTVAHTLTSTDNVMRHILEMLKNVPLSERAKYGTHTFPT